MSQHVRDICTCHFRTLLSCLSAAGARRVGVVVARGVRVHTDLSVIVYGYSPRRMRQVDWSITHNCHILGLSSEGKRLQCIQLVRKVTFENVEAADSNDMICVIGCRR